MSFHDLSHLPSLYLCKQSLNLYNSLFVLALLPALVQASCYFRLRPLLFTLSLFSFTNTSHSVSKMLHSNIPYLILSMSVFLVPVYIKTCPLPICFLYGILSYRRFLASFGVSCTFAIKLSRVLFNVITSRILRISLQLVVCQLRANIKGS